MEIKWLEQTGSTNSYLRERMDSISPMTLVCARSQIAGRGQRGNHWEAEPGKNITGSFYMQNPEVSPMEQFVISEAVALAVVGTLKEFGIDAKVKWPNDIYVGDKKICGILIENAIIGKSLQWSLAGIGLNVNQREFLSDAPNPVSMALIAGKDFRIEEVARSLGRNLESYLSRLSERKSLHDEYMAGLWRRDGMRHPFRDAATGEIFDASVSDVKPTGHLCLETENGIREYAFKEIIFLSKDD